MKLETVMKYGAFVFALLFFIVGVIRVVEIRDAGLGRGKTFVLSALHVIGTLMFSLALGAVGLNIQNDQKIIVTVLFFAGVLTLFPLHIYIAIKRRIRTQGLK